MFKIAKREQNVIYIQNHGTPLHLVACDEDQTISSDQDIYSKGIVDECNQFEAALESAFEFYIDSISAKSNENEVVQHLDLVMLTNGWRRFNWNEVVKGNLPKINYPKDTATW